MLGERQLRTGAHVVRDVAREHPAQACFVHHDHVIEALVTDGADDALNVAFCQGERGAVRTGWTCTSVRVVANAVSRS